MSEHFWDHFPRKSYFSFCFLGNGELVLKSSVNKANAKEEYEIMRQLDHKNIVKVIDGIQFTNADCKYFGIAMMYMRNGDLQNFIDSKKNELPLRWTENDAEI